MSLTPGSQCGAYEIVGPLGTGGMGEVYRARDSKLGRQVAIKVLGVEALANPDAVRRFRHEARAASSLNHPGIVTIHDIGELDGQFFIVMELVEGATLRQLLGRGLVGRASHPARDRPRPCRRCRVVQGSRIRRTGHQE
jgi:serine/threonine protein kinase